MLFSELIRMQSWSLVEATLMLYFPKYQSSLSGFKRAFDHLRTMEPQIGTNEWLTIRKTAEGFDVGSLRGGQKYGLSVTPWSEVLGLAIENQTLTRFSQAEITALVLWEITFYGFDEDTIKKETDKWLKDLK